MSKEDPTKCPVPVAVMPGSSSGVSSRKRKKDLKQEEQKRYIRLVRSFGSFLRSLIQVFSDIKDDKAYLKENAEAITVIKTQAAEKIGEITNSNISEEEYSDEIQKLIINWHRAETSIVIKSPSLPIDAKEQEKSIAALLGLLKEMEFTVGYLTIPDRINSWLAVERPGYFIPFYSVFQDEVSDKSTLEKILKLMKYAPAVTIGGLIDEQSGLIYRYETDNFKRWAEYLLLLASLGASILVVYLMAHWSVLTSIPEWPVKVSDFGILFAGWIAVALGVLIHIVIDVVKKSQSQQDSPPIMSISDLPLIVSAKFGQVLLKLAMILVAFVAIVFTTDDFGKNILFSSLLAGYSLDSVFGLFGQALEKKVETQTTALKGKLGLSE